jgi:hypothetical protein
MSKFSQALAQYIDAMRSPECTLARLHETQEAVCAAIETRAQAQIAFD